MVQVLFHSVSADLLQLETLSHVHLTSMKNS
jgi:hypothetical protein